MVSPFRSEEEQTREHLRRAEEKILELGEEKADLQRQLAIGRRSPGWVVVAGGMLLSGGLGFMIATIDAQKKQARYEVELERYRLREFEAVDARRRAEADLGGGADPSKSLQSTSGATECKCQAGDPLCTCIDGSREPPPEPVRDPTFPMKLRFEAASAAATERSGPGRLNDGTSGR